MSFSDFWEGEILDHVFNIGAYTAPSVYVGYSTADPLDDGSGLAEPAGGGYARVLHSSWARSGNVVDNTGTITFPTTTASQGTITHFALFDAISGGNLLGSGALDTSRALTSAGLLPRFNDGDCNITLD